MKNLQLLPLKMVLEIYPVSRATLYRQIKAGFFPEPVQIGARRVAWRMDEIQKRIDNLQKVALSDRH